MPASVHPTAPPPEAPDEGGEARRVPRVGSDVRVALHLAGLPGPLPARCRDLGLRGACVATDSPFALSALRHLELQLPGGPLRLEAEGRWQRAVGIDDAVLSGIAFRAPSREAVERLWDALQQAGRGLAGFLVGDSDLRDFDAEEAIALAWTSRFREVRAGRPVYLQGAGEPGQDSIFLVERGEVVLQARVRGTREVPLARLGPGRLFGGLPLLGQRPQPDSAIAATDVRLVELDRLAWQHLQRTRPWLAVRLAQAVLGVHADRLHDLLQRTACHL